MLDMGPKLLNYTLSYDLGPIALVYTNLLFETQFIVYVVKKKWYYPQKTSENDKNWCIEVKILVQGQCGP